MTELAKWAWIVLLIVLFIGPWVFAILAADLIIFGLVWYFKPEWLKKL